MSACGGSSGSTPSAPVSQLVKASEGGSVAVAGGSIDIPAGALATDTTITATVSNPDSSTPNSDKVAGKLLELGPDGTTFAMPVTLTIPLTKTPTATQSASLAYLDETVTPNVWVTTASTVANGKVSGGITHFSTWTIIITVNGGAAPDCSFTKCGGALGGTYKVTGACIGGITDDFIKNCPTAIANADVSVTGGITLNADGSYMSDFNATMVKIVFTWQAACSSGRDVRRPLAVVQQGRRQRQLRRGGRRRLHVHGHAGEPEARSAPDWHLDLDGRWHVLVDEDG